MFGRGGKAKPKAVAPKEAGSAWFVSQFEIYADADDGCIGPEGVEKLCAALGVDPAEVIVLVFAWKLGAAQMGYFSRDEWTSAQPVFGAATSCESLLERLKAVHASTLRTHQELRDLHAFAHRFCREKPKKTIDVASAGVMLSLLHADAHAEHVSSLCTFLEGHATCAKRGVSQDEWAMMLQFMRDVKPDLTDYQDDYAWPLLLDDYVEWHREEHPAKES